MRGKRLGMEFYDGVLDRHFRRVWALREATFTLLFNRLVRELWVKTKP